MDPDQHPVQSQETTRHHQSLLFKSPVQNILEWDPSNSAYDCRWSLFPRQFNGNSAAQLHGHRLTGPVEPFRSLNSLNHQQCVYWGASWYNHTRAARGPHKTQTRLHRHGEHHCFFGLATVAATKYHTLLILCFLVGGLTVSFDLLADSSPPVTEEASC
jgi:hypothetical protein